MITILIFNSMFYPLGILLSLSVAFDFKPPGDVCSWNTATSSCTRDADDLQWTYNDMRVAFLTSMNTPGTTTTTVDGIDFTVTLIFLSSSFISSNISFTATPATNGSTLHCYGGISSIATIHVVTDGRSLQLCCWCVNVCKM